MAVQPQTPFKEYTANGTTTVFPLDFDCGNKDHLIVMIDDAETDNSTWSLNNKQVTFNAAPANGKKITLQRNTPYRRDRNYQAYDNSFRPDPVNKDFDWIWWKLQELGVADWILGARIEALKNYVDDRDDELRAYLMEEIRKQGVALDQLDEYYNYLMQRLAQIAVDKGWDASFVVDGDKTQKQINAISKSVVNVVELRNLHGVKNGDTVRTLGHTEIGLGGGTYTFEQLSGKLDNNGSYIASSVAAGTWVLVSDLHFENFGVINDGSDQSVKMQSCIDYADSQGIYSYGFEKPNTYCLSNSIVFKPYLSSSISTFFSTEKRLKITTNGAKLKPLAPIVMVKIHREHVSFDSLEGYAPTAIGATLLRLGLHDDPEYPPEYRHGASFFSAGSLVATNINTGVQFCPSSSNPAGNTYGAYYHNFGEIIYRNVKYGLLLDLAIDGKNQTTRCSVGSYKHNGGSCAFLGLNVETFIIDSFYAENLNTESTEYPLASKRAVYIPKNPSNSTFKNHAVEITGSCEDVPYPIFCEANNCEINIYPAHHQNAEQKSLAGNYNSGYGGTGVMSGCVDLNEFTFPYQTSRSAAVGILAGSAGVVSLPAGMTECYGNIQYLVTSSVMSIEGVQVLHSVYPVVGVFIRRVSGVTPVFGAWSRIDKNTSLLRHSSVTDVNANTLKIDGERVTYGASFSPEQGAALNSPTGGEFYGTIEWIPTAQAHGVQMAYGTYPDVVKKRNFTGVWSVWKTIALT